MSVRNKVAGAVALVGTLFFLYALYHWVSGMFLGGTAFNVYNALWAFLLGGICLVISWIMADNQDTATEGSPDE